MKTFALALCTLVLAVTIQDISAKPQGQRGQGRRSQGQRGQGQPGQGQRGQVRRGQDEGEIGQGQGRRDASAEGRSHGKPKFLRGVCKVLNATTLDVLCDNSIKCPNYTVCSPPPADMPQPPVIGDLLIHKCIPEVCDPADPDPCAPEATCTQSLMGGEYRCNDRRHSKDSSEELEEDEENEVEDEEDEATESCRGMVRDAIRGEVGRRGPGSRGRGSRGRGRGRHGLKFKTCLLRNTTSDEILCNETMSCPDSTHQCVPKSADDDRRLADESLEIYECRPMNCTADGSTCPTNTSCQQFGTTSWCLPEGRRQGRRHHEQDESCNEILKDILRPSHGRKPFGRVPAADAGIGQGEGGNARFGQGEGGNGRFGQGQSGNDRFGQGQEGNSRFGQGQSGNGRSGRGQGGNGRFGQGSNGGFGQGENSPSGVGPLRQGQGLFSQGQMTNGGLGQETEDNENLDVEEEDSSSSEELPRGRPNRPSASTRGQGRAQRLGRSRQP